MKLQPASKKEVKRIAVGSSILAVIELAVFILLHIFKVYTFSYRIPLSIIGGVAITVFCFMILCLTIQRAADTADQKLMKRRMQLSYNIRMVLQAGWVVAAFFAPFLNVVAAAFPLLFPTIIIFYLQKKGKLVEPSTRKNPEPSDEEEEEDRNETLEF